MQSRRPLQLNPARTIRGRKPCRPQIPVAGPATRKSDLVAAISGDLLSDRRATPLAQLSELETRALAEAVHNWNGHFDAVRFKAKNAGRCRVTPPKLHRAFFSRRAEPALQVLLFGPEDVETLLAERTETEGLTLSGWL